MQGSCILSCIQGNVIQGLLFKHLSNPAQFIMHTLRPGGSGIWPTLARTVTGLLAQAQAHPRLQLHPEPPLSCLPGLPLHLELQPQVLLLQPHVKLSGASTKEVSRRDTQTPLAA